ncbi:MAG: hypothetical protein FVQ80_17760 [Planctomycetes bacterium]|nr:hypothetical protein [Planctomycetota bacterium]
MKKPFFALELTGRFFLAIMVFFSAYYFNWWLPLIVAPIFWQIWDIVFGQRSRIWHPIKKLIADGITYIFELCYIIYSIISFGIQIGSWYGWVIGAVAGWSDFWASFPPSMAS